MATEEMYEDDDFIIKLTIDGTEFEGVEVKVTDPNKTIRDQITSIVSVFELPKFYQGIPNLYLLGRRANADDEGEILEFEDENGHQCSLQDYNVKSGDYLFLTTVCAI